jgi:fluoroquinolone transport system permease protein
MTMIKHLVRHEWIRLMKYNLLVASIVISFIWIIASAFLSQAELVLFLPTIFLVEASAMTALLIGAEMYYEKKEHTISSMLISPMSTTDYMISKIIAHGLNTLLVFAIMVVGFMFTVDLSLNFLTLLLGTVFVATFYVGVGLLLSYISKDFTSLLVNYMIMMFIFLIPSILIMAGLLPEVFTDYVKYIPSEISLRLMSIAFVEIDWVQTLIDLGITIVASVGLYYFILIPRFKAFASEHLGV